MGFNIHGKIKFPNYEKIVELENEIKMLKQEQPKKSKRKINFDNLFPAPKNNQNMGLDDFGNKKRRPFQGVF